MCCSQRIAFSTGKKILDFHWPWFLVSSVGLKFNKAMYGWHGQKRLSDLFNFWTSPSVVRLADAYLAGLCRYAIQAMAGPQFSQFRCTSYVGYDGYIFCWRPRTFFHKLRVLVMSHIHNAESKHYHLLGPTFVCHYILRLERIMAQICQG